MTSAADGLSALFRFEQVEEDTYIGPPSTENHVRAFGGQLLAQGLMAAGLTADPKRPAHSMHASFLRPGTPSEPITFQVERLRDGRSFSSRHVRAHQAGRLLFHLSASFHQEETGAEHSASMPDVPAPETLRPFTERFAGRENTDMERWFSRAETFDIRYTGPTPFDSDQEVAAAQQVWFRSLVPRETTLANQCTLAFVSDMTILDAILMRHGMQWTDRPLMGATLDHSIWFHSPSIDCGEWLLFDQSSPVARGGRGFAEGRVWTMNGGLVATIAQEALLRPPGPPTQS